MESAGYTAYRSSAPCILESLLDRSDDAAFHKIRHFSSEPWRELHNQLHHVSRMNTKWRVEKIKVCNHTHTYITIRTPRASACAIPKRGTFFCHNGAKWIVKQILPPLQRQKQKRFHPIMSELYRPSHKRKVVVLPAYLYILEVLPSSSGMHSSGFDTGYVAGIYVFRQHTAASVFCFGCFALERERNTRSRALFFLPQIPDRTHSGDHCGTTSTCPSICSTTQKRKYTQYREISYTAYASDRDISAPRAGLVRFNSEPVVVGFLVHLDVLQFPSQHKQKANTKQSVPHRAPTHTTRNGEIKRRNSPHERTWMSARYSSLSRLVQFSPSRGPARVTSSGIFCTVRFVFSSIGASILAQN